MLACFVVVFGKRIPDGNGKGTGTATDFRKGKDGMANGNEMDQTLHNESSLPGRFGADPTLPFSFR